MNSSPCLCTYLCSTIISVVTTMRRQQVLFNVVTSLKFRKLNKDFEEKMKSDILDIKPSQNVLIFAGKTSNIYKAAAQEYNKLLKIKEGSLTRNRRTV